jgi:NAD(P)-dependent dehydrogenase (short-subunit alcohol dehydrogenase family)
VTNRESLEKAFDQASEELDIVVACAGIVNTASLVDTKLSNWERIITVNLTGVFHTVQITARE